MQESLENFYSPEKKLVFFHVSGSFHLITVEENLTSSALDNGKIIILKKKFTTFIKAK